MFDVVGSAQSVAFIRVDHEGYLLADRCYKLPDLAKWSDRIVDTVKCENGAVGSDARPEQGAVPPVADGTQEKVGMVRLEFRCGGTPCGRVDNG
jgi:hypothetical protein